MFKKSEVNNDNELILSLKNRISELESQLILLAQSNGNIIIKELPNGKLEMNGLPFSNDSEVEYYNSSQATYGELMMYRVGKEFVEREMKKLIQTHMDEIDKFKKIIDNLNNDVENYKNAHTVDEDTINMLHKSEEKLHGEIATLKGQNETDKEMANIEKQTLIDRYEGLISGLEEDINNWKKRYLTINNVTLDGRILTKYGEILS